MILGIVENVFKLSVANYGLLYNDSNWYFNKV